jgi:hypothetical protein
MGTNIIKNEYDGPKKLPKPIDDGEFKLDFAYSSDANEVDVGIRETIRGVKLSIMAMGIALYRVDCDGLFIELGLRKFGAYVDKLAEETGMSRTTIYNWEYIGEAYLKHKTDLERIGFSDEDGATKLPYLAQALEYYPKKEVYKNLVAMSFRKFQDWSKGPVPAIENNHTNVKLNGDQILVGNDPLAVFSDNLAPEDRQYFQSWLIAAAEAKENNEYLRGYKFYDEQEANHFDKIYQRELRSLRIKK